MIISINGPAGSGKSTIAKKLAKKLDWPRYYIGGIRRKKAKEQGLSLSEYNKLGETDPTTDLEVDKYQEQLGKKEDNFIIEGRTSWLFIPHSVKIYLDVEDKEGARRIFNDLQKNDKRNEGKNLNSISDVLKSIRKRKRSDRLRYRKYYSVDVYDKNHYDYVLDTTNLDIKEVFNRIISYIQTSLNEEVNG